MERSAAFKAVSGALVVAAALTPVTPGPASAQAPPAVRHVGMSGSCTPGRLDLSGFEEQPLPAGSSVAVTDTVTEAGASRVLSDTEIAVPVALDTTIPIEHTVLFQSTTGTALFTFVRVTRLFVGGSSASGELVYEETMTATCTGVGPAVFDVRGVSIGAPAPLRIQPRYAG